MGCGFAPVNGLADEVVAIRCTTRIAECVCMAMRVLRRRRNGIQRQVESASAIGIGFPYVKREDSRRAGATKPGLYANYSYVPCHWKGVPAA